jgi:CRP-like cAMP-binding protein
MAARIVELQTKPKRMRADQADRLRQALLPFEEELPEQVVRDLRHHINRLTSSRNKWTFVMLSPEQNAAVVNWLVEHSGRPLVAVRLWALCFEHLDEETGEIHHRREQIAESLGVDPDDVSRIMSELVKMGAIIRRRERIAGLRGPGPVRYFMNPRVATHLAGTARDLAQAEAPTLLTLLEGGKE